MYLYRITRKDYSTRLDGEGACRYGGRWNSIGTRILYTSENPSLSALETLVHFNPNNVPPNLCLIKIWAPNNLDKVKLPKNWSIQKNSLKITKSIGDKFVKDNNYLILEVPSIIIPNQTNLLINPGHKLFHKIKIDKIEDFQIDQRLLK